MPMDLYSALGVARTLSPAARTASANGVGVNRANFPGTMIVIQTGTITDGTHTFDVKESDDNSTYTAVAASDLQGAAPVVGAADDDKVYKVGYLGRKAYVRVDVTVAGATTGGVYSASVIQGGARNGPTP